MIQPSVDAFDVAVVLGARVDADGTPSPAMRRRVLHGVRLLEQGHAKALLMSGGVTAGAVCEADIMGRLAIDAGAPPPRVHLERHALNTIQNARFAAAMARQSGWRRMAVVTDTFHIPRAWYIFHRFGLSPAMLGVRPEHPSREWWLAHGREIAAFPWTILRVEAQRIRRV